MAVPHISFDFSLRGKSCNRINNYDINSSGTDKGLGDL